MGTIQAQKRRKSRQERTRKNIRGRIVLLRLSVFKSNRYLYAQIIDDEKQRTIIGLSEKDLTDTQEESEGMSKRVAKAKKLGNLLAKKAREKKITKVVFDRGYYTYHGVVQALAEGAKEGGLIL